MPFVRVISENKIIEENVTENTNLVVQAGIKKFPYPYLKYKCGMGTCGTCASLIISGKNNLPEPTLGPVSELPPLVTGANPTVVAMNNKLVPQNFNNLTQAQKYELLFRD